MYSSYLAFATAVGVLVWSSNVGCEKFPVETDVFNGIQILHNPSNRSRTLHSEGKSESVYLRCENSKERIKGTNQRIVHAHLINQTHFKLSGRGIKKIHDLACEIANHDEDYVIVNGAGDIRQLDVFVRTNPAEPVYRVWFNLASLTTIRAAHVLDEAGNGERRSDCWAEEFCTTQNPANSQCRDEKITLHNVGQHEYIKMRYDATTFQPGVFRRLNGNPPVPDITVRARYGFDRGHLVPNGDFLDLNKKKSTFYYFNAVPMYWSINRIGNWAKLEDFARTNPPIGRYVETGADGILTYQGTPIYLASLSEAPPRVPIPLYLWKKASWEDVDVGSGLRYRVLFVILNNPFQEAAIEEGDVRQKFPECATGIDAGCSRFGALVAGAPPQFSENAPEPGRVNGIVFCCYTAVEMEIGATLSTVYTNA